MYLFYTDGYKYERTRTITSESITPIQHPDGEKFINKQMPSTGSLYLVHISLVARGYNTTRAVLAFQNGYVTEYRTCDSNDADSKNVSITYFVSKGATVSAQATAGTDVYVESGSIQYVKVI